VYVYAEAPVYVSALHIPVDQFFESQADPLAPLTAKAKANQPIARAGAADNRDDLVKLRRVDGVPLVDGRRLRSHTPLQDKRRYRPASINEQAFAITQCRKRNEFTGETSPHDIRPELIRLFTLECFDAFAPVLAHFQACIAHWCVRTGHPADKRVQQEAVLAALNKTWRIKERWAPNERTNVNVRAKLVGMNAETYSQIERAAISMVSARWAEAGRAFRRCLLGSLNWGDQSYWKDSQDTRALDLRERHSWSPLRPDQRLGIAA
jgi:hypothetical protein